LRELAEFHAGFDDLGLSAEREEMVIRMQSGQLKASPMEHQTSAPSRRAKSSSYLSRIPTERTDLLAADGFCAMLALERRRAQRSQQPFILLLLDARGLEAERRDAAFNERLTGTISGTIRESDIIGWYRQDEILGVIFTEISAGGECSTSEIIHCKILKALRENIEHTVAAKLVVTVHLFPESLGQSRTGHVGESKLYSDLPEKSARKRISIVLKRAIDIVGSAALLLILSPVLAAIAIVIKLTSTGPVIFRQERLGQFGKRFQCLKFRTMFANNDPRIHREYVKSFIAGKVEETHGCAVEAAVFKIQDDPRVTPVGRFLRRMSLDELPQFWNVLRTEMSLVGPRPPLAYEFEAYDLWHKRRVLEVKPGVTGLWQVAGRSRTSFDDMVRMDLRYSQRWSLWLDLKILLATPFAVFRGSGAY